ncbi:hypothetical protein SEUCBS139899_004188 [Sporothrix eucalyptigena]|uniref:pectinesterase n=1 Tax=Sporothrix eucalyptigena TaxID=1812306 RepID=A0ABP0B108_9PEZI
MKMPSIRRAGVALLALASGVLAAPSQYNSYLGCRTATANPLQGCPEGTVLVSASKSHGAHFSTIQSAILSLPDDDSARVILVLPGNYTEQLNITRAGPVTLLGQTEHPNDQSANGVQVYWSAAVVNASYSDNAFTSVLTVAPTLDASLTGSGPTGFAVPADTPFGNVRFSAYNIDFRNVFADYAAGQSLAISISYANAGFYWCGLYSYQDTVYIGKLGNAYFYESEIAGETDFFYGFGTAWIQQCSVSLRGCGGGITAWKGTNTTFPNKYGVYISDSHVQAANTSIAATIHGKCSLGRPWNDLHRSVYLNTELDGSILPAGYTTWNKAAPFTSGSNYDNGTLMAEYHSYGPGFNLTARLAGNVTKELSSAQVRPYQTPKDVFMTREGKQPNIDWIDPLAYPW